MAAKQQMVVFKVGGEEFAIDIMQTKEIVLMRDITPVPETEDYVEGVMNLRGNLVPVLDFRKRVRAAQAADHAERRIIIASLDGRQVGLIVDGVSEVIRVGGEMIEPPPDIIADMGAGYVSGVIVLKERFITLLDLGRALGDEVLASLSEVALALAARREADPRARAV